MHSLLAPLKAIAIMLAIALGASHVAISPNSAFAARRSGGSGNPSVAQAIKRSQQTGQPIFAVAGASYCPACKTLLKTLNTDESLQPLIGQFVALKIDAQSQDYARWKQFFPLNRAAIPALYIVTPKGEKLYGEVGALPSRNLRKVMLSSLEKAGRYPSEKQWQEIIKAIDSTKTALEEKQVSQAVQLLQPTVEQLTPIVPLLELTPTGKEASTKIEDLAVQGRIALDESLESFSSNNDLEAALQLSAAAQLCSLYPQLKNQATKDVRKATANPTNRKLYRQAQELRQAESLAADEDSKRKATKALKQIIKRYPDSEAAYRAERMLNGDDREVQKGAAPLYER